MRAPSARPNLRLRGGVLALLVLAIGLGAVAALVANPASTSNPTSHPIFSSNNDGLLGFDLLGFAALGLIVTYLTYKLYQRLTGGKSMLGGRAVVTIVFYFVLALVFLVAFRSLSPALLPQNAPPHPSNQTGTPGGGGGSGSGQNVSVPLHGPGGFQNGPLPSVPSFTWLDFGLIVVGVLVLLACARYLVYRLETGPDEAGTEPHQQLRAAIEDTLRRLEEDPDPRVAIRALYERWLQALAPRFRQFPESTPREIARESSVRFGVRPEHALELTRLFEEARYSTHPMHGRDADRARAALQNILGDLGGRGGLRPAPSDGAAGAVDPVPPTA